jgi:hypothetical protein
MDHPYTAIARRLKRANGHLETIIEMIKQDRPCAQIAQQLQAVENAIESAKKGIDTRSCEPKPRTVVCGIRLERPPGAAGLQTYRQVSVAL